jgi:hypothetical protein
MGRAMYNTWTRVEQDLWGSSPRAAHPDHRKLFRAWWIMIISTLADTPDFPTIQDFYSALMAQTRGYFQYEARMYYRLVAEMEALGLTQGCM